jgi:hypothetical protein
VPQVCLTQVRPGKVRYYEFLNPNPQTYTVRSQPVLGTPLVALAVERSAAAPVYYINLASVIFLTPFVGGNFVNVQSTPAPTLLGLSVDNGDTVILAGSTPTWCCCPAT